MNQALLDDPEFVAHLDWWIDRQRAWKPVFPLGSNHALCMCCGLLDITGKVSPLEGVSRLSEPVLAYNLFMCQLNEGEEPKVLEGYESFLVNGEDGPSLSLHWRDQ